MAKEKQIETLKNGATIKTTHEGWNKTKVSNYPVMFAGWKEGAASHHSIGHALAMAVVNSDHEDMKSCVLGEYPALTEGGAEKLIPTVNPTDIHELMAQAFVEKYGLEVPTLRIATNRTTQRKQLEEKTEALNNTYQMIAKDAAMVEIIKNTQPDMYENIKPFL